MLTKLKFDESVSGYALITSSGHPFLVFSLPDTILPQIKGTLRIHGADLKLVNIMSDKGIVILARVNPEWVLTVLFEPDFQLGGALSRTKAVVDLLVQVNLPSPPAFPDEEEVPVPTEYETQAPESSTMADEPMVATGTQVALEITPEPEVAVPHEPEPSGEPKEPVEVRSGCIVYRDDRYVETMTLDSALNSAIKKEFANTGIDILLIVDEKKTVYDIAEHLSRAVEKVIQIVNWCITRNILWVECPEEPEPSQKEIIELPLFEGKINKVKKQHRAVIELCDGKRTLQEIAAEIGIPYFEALQAILPYRGKTLRIVRTDKGSIF